MAINLKDYTNLKKAKLIVADLEAIILELNASIERLMPFRKYLPVKDVLKELNNQRMLLRMFHKKYSNIVENQGKDENKVS